MRHLILALLLTACDDRDGLIVPEPDTDQPAPECLFVFTTEEGPCDQGGYGYWEVPPRTVYTIYRCNSDWICVQSGATVENGFAKFTCSEHGDDGDFWRVDYITN